MLDIFDDNGALLKHYYPSVDSLPDYIRSSPSLGPLDKVASEDFAALVPITGGIKRAFPIANDAATAISCLYFEHTHSNLPSELQKSAAVKLKDACDRFDLEPTAKVAELSTEYHGKTASANRLKTPFPSQGIEGTPWFPLSTKEQVKLASDLYGQIIPKLSPAERVEFTQNLSKQASVHGVGLPKTAERYVGNSLSHVAVLDAIEKRAAYMTEDQRHLLQKSADRIMEMHPDKVAELLGSMDTELGLDVMYDSKIPDPQAIRAFAPVEEKVAHIGDLEVSEETWKQACDAGVLSMFDDRLQSALRQHPEMLNNYEGTPVLDAVVDGLKSIGIS